MGKSRDQLAKVMAPLDYEHLNQLLDQPTDENLARWVRDRLSLDDGVNNVYGTRLGISVMLYSRNSSAKC